VRSFTVGPVPQLVDAVDPPPRRRRQPVVEVVGQAAEQVGVVDPQQVCPGVEAGSPGGVPRPTGVRMNADAPVRQGHTSRVRALLPRSRVYTRDDNGSAGRGSRVKWVNKSEWVTWVTGQYS